MKVYKCDTPCTWSGRYWGEGDFTDPLSEEVKPPEHFSVVTNTDELLEVLDGIDEEEDPQTFAQLSRQIMDAGNTGTGILAGDDLQLKNYKQLKKIALDMGIDAEEIKSKEGLIEAIEAARNEE